MYAFSHLSDPPNEIDRDKPHMTGHKSLSVRSLWRPSRRPPEMPAMLPERLASELSRDIGRTPQVASVHSHHTGLAINEFEENKADTPERTVAERHIEAVRQQGGLFVEAVRRTACQCS